MERCSYTHYKTTEICEQSITHPLQLKTAQIVIYCCTGNTNETTALNEILNVNIFRKQYHNSVTPLLQTIATKDIVTAALPHHECWHSILLVSERSIEIPAQTSAQLQAHGSTGQVNGSFANRHNDNAPIMPTSERQCSLQHHVFSSWHSEKAFMLWRGDASRTHSFQEGERHPQQEF
jgi:hypothetical protein